MATLELEGAERGWVASVGLDSGGRPRLIAVAEPALVQPVETLLQRLLEEPAPGGGVIADALGQGEELLQLLARAISQRRPLLRQERLHAYVAGGRFQPPPGPLGWDEE